MAVRRWRIGGTALLVVMALGTTVVRGEGRVFHDSVSLDGTWRMVWRGKTELKADGFRVSEVRGGRVVGRCAVDGSRWNALIHWTAGGNILHVWGAGSCFTLGKLLDRRCRAVANLDDFAAASPGWRYAVVARNPPCRPRIVEEGRFGYVEVVDLSMGGVVWSSKPRQDVDELGEVTWQEDAVVLPLLTTAGTTEVVTVPLGARP